VGWIRSSHAAQTFVRPFDRRIPIQKSNFSLRYFDKLSDSLFCGDSALCSWQKIAKNSLQFLDQESPFFIGSRFRPRKFTKVLEISVDSVVGNAETPVSNLGPVGVNHGELL
jgi:hypothetical protein